MTQTSNKLFDELAKMMTDAAGAAQGARQEVESMIRSQGERVMREMDVVSREEFDAVKTMAVKAREQGQALEVRINELEAKIEKLVG